MPDNVKDLTNLFGETEKFIKNQFRRIKAYKTSSLEAFLLTINALKDNNDTYITDFVDNKMAAEYIIQARSEAKKLGLKNAVTVSYATKQYLIDLKAQLLTLNRQYYEGAAKAARNLGNIFNSLSPEDLIKKSMDEINKIVIESVIKEQSAAGLAKELAGYVNENKLGVFNSIENELGITKIRSINPVTGKVINFDPETIADTWARTAMRDVTEQARHDYYKANNLDLIIVSTHGDACPLCTPWEGVVLSITGKTEGYYTYEQAKTSGLMHPNCEHNTYSYYANEEKASGAVPEFGNLTDYQQKLVNKAGVKT